MNIPVVPTTTNPAHVLRAAAAIAEAGGLGPEADIALEWDTVLEPVIRIRVNPTVREGEPRLEVVRRVADALGADIVRGEEAAWQPGLMIPTAHARTLFLGVQVEVHAELEDTL